MDPAIIAAIILAVTNVVTFALGRLRAKKLENKIVEADKAIPTIPDMIVDQCGFKVTKAKQTIKIDLDGSYRCSVLREGIQATSQTIQHFVHQISISQGEISDPELTGQVSPKALDLRVLKSSRTNRMCQFFITVAGGGLSEKDGEINYSYVYSASRAFCMTKEEADQAYKDEPFKYEYCSVVVASPMKRIELEVEFPDGYVIKQPYLATFVGLTEFINDKEFEKRSEQGCLKQIGDNIARLEINEPAIGFRYAIYWTPISKKEYEKLFKKS